MGIGFSFANDNNIQLKEKPEKMVQHPIEKIANKQSNSSEDTFRILLLGVSESGKTTIFKQMRILHLNGFSNDDRSEFRQSILHIIVDSIAHMLKACEEYRITHENVIQGAVKQFLQFYNEINEETELNLSNGISKTIERIWQSSTIQMIHKRRFHYKLFDNAKYFLDSLERISAEDYLPTIRDILQCRYRTTGIRELNFVYKKLDFKMVDVGGQQTERRKWIHCFDNVNMVLFIVAMSDFDRSDPDDANQNRMIQSQRIFQTITQSDYFKNASIVLFLNKFDIFREKLKYSSLKTCWPEYDGDNSIDDCTTYVKKQFGICVSKCRKYFPFVTTATDTNNIDFVFRTAVAHIINQNLKVIGLQE